METYSPKVGDIILFQSKKGWFSSLQRIFTRRPETHVGMVIGNVAGFLCHFGANLVATVSPVVTGYPDCPVRIFRPKIDDPLIQMHGLFARYHDAVYGFSQLFFFVMRWFVGLFGIDARKWKNIMPSGDICSEIAYNYLKNIKTYLPEADQLTLQRELDRFNENTVHAGDIAEILKNVGPLAFECVYTDYNYKF